MLQFNEFDYAIGWEQGRRIMESLPPRDRGVAPKIALQASEELRDFAAAEYYNHETPEDEKRAAERVFSYAVGSMTVAIQAQEADWAGRDRPTEGEHGVDGFDAAAALDARNALRGATA